VAPRVKNDAQRGLDKEFYLELARAATAPPSTALDLLGGVASFQRVKAENSNHLLVCLSDWLVGKGTDYRTCRVSSLRTDTSWPAVRLCIKGGVAEERCRSLLGVGERALFFQKGATFLVRILRWRLVADPLFQRAKVCDRVEYCSRESQLQGEACTGHRPAMIKRIAWNTWYGDDALTSTSESEDSETTVSTGDRPDSLASESDPEEEDVAEDELARLSRMQASRYQVAPRDAATLDAVMDSSTKPSYDPANDVLSDSGEASDAPQCRADDRRQQHDPETQLTVKTARIVKLHSTSRATCSDAQSDGDHSVLPPAIEKRSRDTFQCQICRQVVLLNARDMWDHARSKRHLRRLHRLQETNQDAV